MWVMMDSSQRIGLVFPNRGQLVCATCHGMDQCREDIDPSLRVPLACDSIMHGERGPAIFLIGTENKGAPWSF